MRLCGKIRPALDPRQVTFGALDLPSNPSRCHMKINVAGIGHCFISAAMELGLSVHASKRPHLTSSLYINGRKYSHPPAGLGKPIPGVES
jgi:hypothetical protein